MVALESYDGIVLLATNLKANIDPAFIRRIRHLVDFPRPDIHARHEIWKRTLQALFGDPVALRLERDLERISVLETTGAQIKNAALAVAFASRKHRGEPDLDLLGRMVARELAKDGGGLSDRDLRAVLDAAERQS